MIKFEGKQRKLSNFPRSYIKDLTAVEPLVLEKLSSETFIKVEYECFTTVVSMKSSWYPTIIFQKSSEVLSN